MRPWFILLGVLSFLGAATPVHAQRDARVPDPDPELERKTFKLAEGFEVNLFAADPLLAKPIQMSFDPRGRLWIACSEAYPQLKPGQKQNDKIIILEDTNGDGKADRTTVFAEGLLIPTGIAPGDGGVYVVDSTDLIHLSDTDGDGKADRRRVILSGFGTEDTHHMVHSLRWGPDGMLYFNQSIYIHSHIETPHGPRRLGGGGTWQFRPETRQLEVFARGWVNPWGHHFDRWGVSFVTDGAGGEGINYVVPGASYPTAVGASRILHGLNPGTPKYCGLEILSGTHLPEDWRGSLITNDFRGHRVCRYVVKEDGAGYAAQEKTELIKSNHPAFRPVDVRMGPDGAIYIADWYNPIIQHGEVDFRDPRRDQTHGRIWRITAKGRPLVERPKLVDAKIEALLDALKQPEGWTRHQARRVLKERGAQAVLPALAKWVKALEGQAPTFEEQALEGLWTYQALDVVEPQLLKTLLNARNPQVRGAATRVLGAWQNRLDHPLELLAARVNDDHPRVRLEAVRALSTTPSAHAVEIAVQALSRPLDLWLDYALWLTVRDQQARWLPAFQKGALTFQGNIKGLTYALQAIGSREAVRPLVELVQKGKIPADSEEGVLGLIAALGEPGDLRLVFDLVLKDATPATRKTALLDGLAQAMRQRRVRPNGELTTLRPLFTRGEEGARAAALRLAGLWQVEALREGIVEQARARETPIALRQAAMDALVSLGDRKAVETLQEIIDQRGTAAEQRRLALVGLTALDTTAASGRVVAVLASDPKADPSEVITAFLQQKQGMPLLIAALKEKELPADVAKLAVRTARSTGRDTTALVDALTKAGKLTTAKRTLTPTELQQLVAEVAQTGDAARGEALFRRKDQLCLKCHAIAGAGGQVGPDLSSIGASAQVDYLIESLLLPNKAVKENYHATLVTTKKGQLYTGIKVRQTKTELVLRTAEDQELTIPLPSIEEQAPAASLMPEGLTDPLTRGELIDLVRFLSELGKIGPYQVSKARLVRRWQTLEPTREAYTAQSRQGTATVATEASWQTWSPAYSTVRGTLALDGLPKFTLRRALEKDMLEISHVRCQLDVTTPGKVNLLFNSPRGLKLWVDGQPVEVHKETALDLKTGLHTLTLTIDRRQRSEDLGIEVLELPGSRAQVRVVGGK